MHINRQWITAGLVTAALGIGFAFDAAAHPLSRQECSEGSDFIKNAALSRDNGMDGGTFLSRTIEDLSLIKSFPPSMRWFVQDQNDEDYLLKAVAEVFSSPREPQLHQSSFFGECITRAASGE
jgi:hypothetical protein